MMYANKRFDISKDVIRELGLVPGATDEEDTEETDEEEDGGSGDQPVKLDKP